MQTMNWLNDLCVSSISFIYTYDVSARNYPMKNNGRRHHGFIYTLQGTETYAFADKTLVAVPDSVIYIPKGATYSITLSGERSTVIAFDFELALPAPQEPFRVKFPENNSVKALFSESEKIWNRQKTDCPAACKSHFYKLCSALIHQKMLYSSSLDAQKIADAVSYLHSHYLDQDFRIETLSGLSRMSTRYFEKLFYQRFGMSPKEYVIGLKIERAKELLLSEKILIKDIACQLGYNDIYHFGKLFKQKTGYTPSTYRKGSHSD